MNWNRQINNQGYMTLLSVLIMGAIASVIATAVVMTGVSRVQTSGDHLYGASALALGHACVELALDRVRSNGSYTGTTTEDGFPEGECSYTVTSSTIEAQGIFKDHTRRVEVTFETKSPLVIEAWQEVAEFGA